MVPNENGCLSYGGYRSSDDKYSDLAKVRDPLNEVINF
jgi:hypothetical protein